MSEIKLQVNPQAKWHAMRIGAESTPVLLVDHFALNLPEIKQDAINNAEFSRETATYYPGVRAHLPVSLLKSVVAILYPGMLQLFGLNTQQKVVEEASYYSMVNTPATDLLALQRIPHFDSTNRQYFAIMLYMNDGEFGGTGFYRHQESGFESITEARWPTFRQLRENYQVRAGLRPASYFSDTNDEFELMGKIAYKANRLVVYPGNLLHSGLINHTRELSADPANGRLTANFFVQFT